MSKPHKVKQNISHSANHISPSKRPLENWLESIHELKTLPYLVLLFLFKHENSSYTVGTQY